MKEHLPSPEFLASKSAVLGWLEDMLSWREGYWYPYLEEEVKNVLAEQRDQLDDADFAELLEVTTAFLAEKASVMAKVFYEIEAEFRSELEALGSGSLEYEEAYALFVKLDARIKEATKCAGVSHWFNYFSNTILYSVQAIQAHLAPADAEAFKRACSVFSHDLSGPEVKAFKGLRVLEDTDPENEEEVEIAADAMGLSGLPATLFIKYAASMERLSQDLNPELEGLGQERVDLFKLLERICSAAHSRFNFDRGGHIDFRVSKEADCNTELYGSITEMFLVFWNFIKNTSSLYTENPELRTLEHQPLEVHFFEREGVRLVHLWDQAGGIDVTKLIQKRVDQLRSMTNAELSQLTGADRKIIGGSWRMGNMTLAEAYELMFYGRLSTRKGHSGIGMDHARKVLDGHGALVKPGNHREGGAQFLIAFSPKEMKREVLERIMNEAAAELDAAENERIWKEPGPQPKQDINAWQI